MSAARCAAVEALIHQEKAGYSNLVLDGRLRRSGLTGRDKAFCTAIFYTVLEHQITLDWQLRQCLNRPVTRLDPPVRAVLRAGLAQIVYMQVPPAAAVNESVTLVRKLGCSSAAGLVNAVLRRAPAQDPAAAKFPNRAARLSVQYSVAEPIVRLYLAAYPTRAEQLLLSMSTPSKETALRVNTLRTSPEQLAQRLADEGTPSRPGPLPGSLLAAFEGSPIQSAAFAEGLFHVQGLSSQLAALSLDAQPGQKVLDLCAAPGGKTLLLAQQMQDTGRLYSRDAAEGRVSLIRQALERGGIQCADVACADASVWQPELARADRVLCDVPCSGLGILRKKPDLRYKPLGELPSLCVLQAKILATASRYVKEGGRLVYSTCTLNPQENEYQIEQFLAGEEGAKFRLVPPPFHPEQASEGPFGMTIFPYETGFDGFFIATLERL